MRKGFTLVELLIVIVVIGVLSAMMMLSSTEAVSTAKASNIISNLTQFKKAMLAWYTDNLERVKKDSTDNNVYKIYGKNGKKQQVSEYVRDNSAEILKYLSNGSSIKLKNKSEQTPGYYVMTGINQSKEWYICYILSDSDSRIKEKLASRAKSIRLFGTNTINLNGSTAMEKSYYTNQKFAVLPILKLE